MSPDSSELARRFRRAWWFGDLRPLGRWAQRIQARIVGRRRRPFAFFDPAARECFIQRVPSQGMALEIGPFGNPALHGDHVRYADALSTEQLKAIAKDYGMDPERCPPIHYVVTETPLEKIPDRFASVFSSHCIEHQTDLVQHLQAVETLLEPGGAYYLVIPDKRYCFDHFCPASTIADVIAAHAERRTCHAVKSFVTQHLLQAHNDARRHWAGDHGEPSLMLGPGRLEDVMNIAREGASGERYVDTHAWQFTPESFEEICRVLYEGGLTGLRPVVVLPTAFNRFEFCAVLTRARPA